MKDKKSKGGVVKEGLSDKQKISSNDISASKDNQRMPKGSDRA